MAMIKYSVLAFLCAASFPLCACAADNTVKDATAATIAANSAWYNKLNFNDRSEQENAVRGLIDAPKTLEIVDEKDGSVVWSQTAFAFVDKYQKAPDTVNPSLWEDTVNNHAYGLFEVKKGIYQVRGYDMANFTVVAGDTGWIVFDTTTCLETAKACMALIDKNLGKRPIKAIIISHSHIDHYGGVGGVVTEEELADPTLPIDEQIASGKVPLIVPAGFQTAAVSENLFVGKAMGRRANYQYGVYLKPGEKGRAAMGIGLGQATGITTYYSPTYEIEKTGEIINIDGVDLEFQITPGTEAPAEMNTWIPSMKALWLAENCTGTLHNLYTLRGAAVRDGNAWAKYITEAIALYGDKAEVTFQSHNWPHWGNPVINDYMANTAAVYKFINDQTLSYINQGYTAKEISNMIELPDKLARNWYTRQYYGTVAHNSQAVYEKYMGWYDANPVHLDPLSPSESAKKWVEYLGDVNKVLKKAKADFDAGEYRWVAEVTNTLVFADPKNKEARYLCADALEQLGYQAESGTWRNSYLMAAKELREGNQPLKRGTKIGRSSAMATHLTTEDIFDYLGIILDKKIIADKNVKINFIFKDNDQKWMLHLNNGAVLHYENFNTEDADLTITTVSKAMIAFSGGTLDEFKRAAEIKGDPAILEVIFRNRTQGGTADFNLVEP